MHHFVRTFSKFFVIVVMLFGSPPVVRLRDLRRPTPIVMISRARYPLDGWPLPHPSPITPEPGGEPLPQRTYLPVKAA